MTLPLSDVLLQQQLRVLLQSFGKNFHDMRTVHGSGTVDLDVYFVEPGPVGSRLRVERLRIAEGNYILEGFAPPIRRALLRQLSERLGDVGKADQLFA